MPYQIQKLAPQRIIVKATGRSDHPWSAIFRVIIYTAHKINEKFTRPESHIYITYHLETRILFLSPVSSAEIKIIINSMKTGKTVAPYNIITFLIKCLVNIFQFQRVDKCTAWRWYQGGTLHENAVCRPPEAHIFNKS